MESIKFREVDNQKNFIKGVKQYAKLLQKSLAVITEDSKTNYPVYDNGVKTSSSIFVGAELISILNFCKNLPTVEFSEYEVRTKRPLVEDYSLLYYLKKSLPLAKEGSLTASDIDMNILEHLSLISVLFLQDTIPSIFETKISIGDEPTGATAYALGMAVKESTTDNKAIKWVSKKFFASEVVASSVIGLFYTNRAEVKDLFMANLLARLHTIELMKLHNYTNRIDYAIARNNAYLSLVDELEQSTYN